MSNQVHNYAFNLTRAEVKAPFLTSKNGLPCAWEDILPYMPQGILCYATNDAELLHVEPDLAIITQYGHDTRQYLSIDGTSYKYAEPAMPCESTLDIKVSWATAPPLSKPGTDEYFGTVKDGEDPLLADNDNDNISKF